MPVIDVAQPEFMDDEEISIFADAVGKFYEKHAPEKRVLKWREDGQVRRRSYRSYSEYLRHQRQKPERMAVGFSSSGEAGTQQPADTVGAS